MEGTLVERAIKVAAQLLPLLEREERSTVGHRVVPRSIALTRTQPTRTPAQYDAQAIVAAQAWEQEQLERWRQAGRLTAEGVLRVDARPLAPYRLPDVRRIMPHLGLYDQVAVLVELNGIIQEGDMADEDHENIRQVVKHISREECEHYLNTPEGRDIVAEIATQAVSAVFGTLLEKLDAKRSTLRVGGRQVKCSKCRKTGHRAPTCPATPEEIAAAHQEEAEASPA